MDSISSVIVIFQLKHDPNDLLVTKVHKSKGITLFVVYV
jgi:hypothetical protein